MIHARSADRVNVTAHAPAAEGQAETIHTPDGYFTQFVGIGIYSYTSPDARTFTEYRSVTGFKGPEGFRKGTQSINYSTTAVVTYVTARSARVVVER